MLKLKKIQAGQYEAKQGNVEIDIYKGKGYWGATVTVGSYGDNDWEERVFSNFTKGALVKDIEAFLNRV